MILIIESSARFCSVALTDMEGNVRTSGVSGQPNSHAENLPVLVESALAQLKVDLLKLSAVGIGKGPGSYTGLRIGTSIAKGLCYSMNIPLLSLNAFLGMFHYAKAFHDAEQYVVTLDARRDEVYSEVYGAEKGLIYPVHSKIITKESYSELNGSVLYIGDCNEKIRRILGEKSQTGYLYLEPSAEFLAGEAIQKYSQKEYEDIAYFEPLYLKDFKPGIPKKFSL